MAKHRISYPYPNYRKEIKYRGERAYMNDSGYWIPYNCSLPIRFSDTIDGFKWAVDRHIEYRQSQIDARRPA